MSCSNGQLLLVACLLLIFSINLNRSLSKQEEGPVLLSGNETSVTVELGSGFPDATVHQFIDGTRLLDVIKLTDMPVGESVWTEYDPKTALRSGQRIDLEIKKDLIVALTLSWMPASRRMATGIPLHPDRMTKADWQQLPGIGEKMARRIEQNRQKYGEFGSIWNLKRVPGVGVKLITSWNQYFFTDSPTGK